MRTSTLTATTIVVAASLATACSDSAVPTAPDAASTPVVLTADVASATPPLPDADDRILFDTRAALQQATTMREALALWGFSADTRANLGFTTDMDEAGTNAMRVDWPASASCASVSPTLGKALPTPLPGAVYIHWKQRLGRTATGGGLGDVDGFQVFRDACGSSGRFNGFSDRSGSSNRLEYRWRGPSPARLQYGVKYVAVLEPNRGWTFDPQQHVGQVLEHTLYYSPESVAGARDGVLRLWVNGRLLIDSAGLALGTQRLSKFVLPWTAHAPAAPQSEYFWDLVIWEPLGVQTPPDTTPPPPPPDTTTPPDTTPPPPPPDTTTPPDTTPAAVASVSVSPPSANLLVGNAVQLSAIARDSSGKVLTGRPVTWASSAPTVAEVSATGVVTARGEGTATVTAFVEGKSGFSQINVQAPAAPGSGWHVSPSGSSAGDGSAANPWNLATAAAGAGGKVQPGDTIWVRGGTYGDEADMTVGGTADAPVVLSGYPGETAIIKKQFDNTANYVVIQHLTFEGPIDRAHNQVRLYGHHVVFTRNEIRNGDYHAGLSVDESHHMTITYNYIHHNGIDTRIDHGIYFKTTQGPGTVIANNLVVENAARGISLHDNSGTGVYDVVVAHNTVVGNGSAGIMLNEGDRNTVVNNIVVGNGDKTGQGQIRIKMGDNNKVWNNLTWHATASSRAGIQQESSCELRDNIVADPLFVGSGRTPLDLRLQAGSPAIGRALVGWTFGHDHAGKARDGAPDIGAFEH